MKEGEPTPAPQIIDEINKSLKAIPLEDRNMENLSVEVIAEKIGVNKKRLYEWVKSDAEFTTALERLKDVQEKDPFKTGTEEDTFVNAMMIALVLLETKDRKLKNYQ